ncbi:MAG: 50S ribosomal protein L32 [Chloroflexota bacterium]
MVPLTKKKSSRSHTRERRAHHAITQPQLVECPKCHSQKMPHQVCPVCGTYNGREVITPKTPKKKS